MPKISTETLTPEKKLFHNEWINVYPTTLHINEIKFWADNNRTIFTFERLEHDTGKKLSELPLEDITKFVAAQSIHKLDLLADSIERNGVQVPLIIRDDGKLLDGNRRYFACQLLRIQNNGTELPTALTAIPVHVIRAQDLDQILELKILAEANFIKDLKVAWPLDAQARAVDSYYQTVLKESDGDANAAMDQVTSVFGISRGRANDLLGTLKLTLDFIAAGTTETERIVRRSIVEERFVYFWEFINKATKGRGAIKEASDLNEVTDMFFSLMAKGSFSPIKNVKQIEPMIQAKRDPIAWPMLIESKGAKLSIVVSIINDKKTVRKAEDTIRVFHSWLLDTNSLSDHAKSLLNGVITLAQKKLEGK